MQHLKLRTLFASAGFLLLIACFLLFLQPVEHSPFLLTSNFLLALLLTVLYVRISGIYALQEILLLISILSCALLIGLVAHLVVASNHWLHGLVDYPILAPLPVLMIALLLPGRAGLLAVPLCAFLFSMHWMPDRFFWISFACSLTVAWACRQMSHRTEIFTACFKAWGVSLAVLYAFSLSDGHLWEASLLSDGLVTGAFLLGTALLSIGLLPLFESLFSILTDTALMEYMNPNHALLRQFAEEMPGTYQHSIALGHLSEAAAQTVGGNGLFCRAATLYHDIGKLNNPDFYTENQPAGVNMHQLMTPLESAQVIIAHVLDGVALAKKHGLPEAFIDIIREHHGTTLVYYFYHKQTQSGEPADEALFRYPGPKPHSKESAIIMICDSVEAASHSMEQFTAPAIAEMVDRIVAEKAQDGQFDECSLTFEELGRVKRSVVQSLLRAHHARVKYPCRITHL